MGDMKKTLLVLAAFFCAITASAQSADVITEILETEEVTFGQISYIVAVQMDLVGEKDSLEIAIEKLYEKGIIPAQEDPDAAIPAVDVAFIYSKLWKIKGGLMYRITKGSPRYAFKQFKSDGVINQDLDPGASLSGAEALSMYTACVNTYSDFDMKNVSMEDE